MTRFNSSVAATIDVEAKLPPVKEGGVIRWLQQNIFCTWYDALGSFAVIYILFLVVPPMLEWAVFTAVWDASSSQACQAKGDGACWAMINSRIGQFIYGFYESADVWRVNLTFGLFLALFVPALVLQGKIRSILVLLLIVVFPIIAYDLLQGGLTQTVLDSSVIGGFTLTVVLTVVGIAVSFPMGIALALGRISDLPAIKWLSIFFIELIRSVPLITILFMAQFLIPLFMPEGVTIDNLLRVIIGIVLFSSAYTAEVIRGGLQAIPKGQYEAADALSLSYWKKTRHIIMPQAIRIVIPGLVNNFISLFKDTTLVAIVGMFDFLLIVVNTEQDTNWMGTETEGYTFIALVFFIICYSMSRYSRHLEVRLNTGHKAD